MNEDKLRYTVNYGVARGFKAILLKDVESSKCGVVSFDENLNPKTQEHQLQFFRENVGKVETCHWHSQIIAHSTVNDILEHFCKCLELLYSAILRQAQWIVHQQTGKF